jgi:hypothetical protein
LFGQSTILRDFMPFSREFSGLKIKKTVSIMCMFEAVRNGKFNASISTHLGASITALPSIYSKFPNIRLPNICNYHATGKNFKENLPPLFFNLQQTQSYFDFGMEKISI